MSSFFSSVLDFELKECLQSRMVFTSGEVEYVIEKSEVTSAQVELLPFMEIAYNSDEGHQHFQQRYEFFVFGKGADQFKTLKRSKGLGNCTEISDGEGRVFRFVNLESKCAKKSGPWSSQIPKEKGQIYSKWEDRV